MMKVLFIRSANNGIDPISQSQGESLVKEGINVVYYNIKGNGIFGYLSNISRLRKKINEENPDICHAHFSLTGYVAALSLTRKPIVTSLMGSDVNASSLFQKVILKIFIFLFWNKIIVKSQQMKDLLNYSKAIVLPNGVDLDRFYVMDKVTALDILKWNKYETNVLFASNPDRPEKNYKLAREALMKLSLGNLKIHHLMNINQNELVYYYNAADCLMLTSFYEGSPNVIKEALACNCPIVSTKVGDVESLIKDVDGCYLTSFDSDDVYMKLKNAIAFKGRTKGRDNISHIDSRLIAKRLITIYTELIN